MTTVYLTDTTLRDGEQGCGFALKASDKQKLAKMLDDAGFYQIEAGIPAMGNYEKDAICGIMDVRKHAKIAVWNRMRKDDISHSFDCKPDIIHISAPVSDIMIRALLKKDRAWVVKKLKQCITFSQGKGYDVTVGFQDASRADVDFMALLANEIAPINVKSIRLADTVGILTPMRTHRLFKTMANKTSIPMGIHTHNDLGMATAVAVEAVRGGAMFVDTTLFGIGERAGNCDSYKFAAYGQTQCCLSSVMKNLENMKAHAIDILFSNGGKEKWNLN